MAMQLWSLITTTSLTGNEISGGFHHPYPHLRPVPVRPISQHLFSFEHTPPQLRSRNVVSFQAPPSAQTSELTDTTSEITRTKVGTKKENENMNWDELGYNPIPTDYMYIMECSDGQYFSNGQLIRYGNIELSPSSGIINYGEGLFEGLKAYRRQDGRIMLFRPEQNALRMTMGAERLCMPSPSVEKFVDAIKKTVLANRRWVPPQGKGALYIRPLLMGSGSVLSPGPSSKYKFLIYVTPVGISHHKGGKAVSLIVEEKLRRAAPGGTGGIKSITNYSPVYKAVSQAKAKGFSDVLFLDAETGKNIEEVSTSNIFIIKGHIFSTPPIHGTVLPGITRKSIIDIARSLGYKVEERAIPLEEVLNADEVFCTGTAVVVNSVGSITYRSKRVEYRTGPHTVAQMLNTRLTGIQNGLIHDTMGWTVVVD